MVKTIVEFLNELGKTDLESFVKTINLRKKKFFYLEIVDVDYDQNYGAVVMLLENDWKIVSILGKEAIILKEE